MIKNLCDKKVILSNSTKCAENSTLVGDIEIGENSSIWYNAVLRADLSYIKIGNGTNIQDNATIHVDKNQPCVIGDNVTIGHNAIVHGATIEDNCLIGMGAVILNGAKILKGSIVAAGAVVTENMTIGPKMLAVGIPAKIITEIDNSHYNMITKNAIEYIELSKNHFIDTSN